MAKSTEVSWFSRLQESINQAESFDPKADKESERRGEPVFPHRAERRQWAHVLLNPRRVAGATDKGSGTGMGNQNFLSRLLIYHSVLFAKGLQPATLLTLFPTSSASLLVFSETVTSHVGSKYIYDGYSSAHFKQPRKAVNRAGPKGMTLKTSIGDTKKPGQWLQD